MMRGEQTTVERLLRNPARTLMWTFVTCTLGFLAVGWLASVESTLGLSWRAFNPGLGFAFAAAFAQLVLAGVVWAQIKASDDALRHARAESAAVTERAHRQRTAEALANFVGYASNASALYGGTVRRRLSVARACPGDPKYLELARDAVAQADQARQAAHAERFHVIVRTTSDGAEFDAMKDFLKVIDRQHQRAGRVITDLGRFVSGSPWEAPSLHGIYCDPNDIKKRCLDLASALLEVSSDGAFGSSDA